MNALIIPFRWFRPLARAQANYARALERYEEAVARQDTRSMHDRANDLRRANLLLLQREVGS